MELITFFIICSTVLGLLLYSTISHGVVLYYFYNWFLLPVFHNLPEITFVQAFGLALFINLFKLSNSTKYKYKEQEIKTDINWAYYFIGPWLTLLFGYITYQIFF